MFVRNLITICLVLLPLIGWTAPPPPPNRLPPPPPRQVSNDDLRQLRVNLSDLKNEVGNHTVEIKTFGEKLHNQESSLDQIRQQLTDDLQVQQDFSKASTVHLQGKIDSLESILSQTNSQLEKLTQVNNGLTNDLRNFRTQSNDSVQVLELYKQKLNELESKIASQNQHIGNLESALQSIMELLQPKESNTGKTYKVQAGDNLEKISRMHHITIQQLRDANQLTTDRINIGQTLKIP